MSPRAPVAVLHALSVGAAITACYPAGAGDDPGRAGHSGASVGGVAGDATASASCSFSSTRTFAFVASGRIPERTHVTEAVPGPGAVAPPRSFPPADVRRP